MPRLLDNDFMAGKVGNFTYSGVRPDRLAEPEYTLVTIVTDTSGSVAAFAANLRDCIVSILEACKKNPRAEKLLIRRVEFNSTVMEIHGFTELSKIDIQAISAPSCHGMTALYDACFSSIGACNDYAKQAGQNGVVSNGVTFIITDGCDNMSAMGPADIKRKVDDSLSGEIIESQMTILIGLNLMDPASKKELEHLRKEANLTQFVDVGDATPKNLAKLADFVSRSISSQSSSLGTGGPSQPLTI